jgi:DNA adenine methylase
VKTLGTCTCGHFFVFAGGEHERMDAAIEAHWQKFDSLPLKVDGRGQPILDPNTANPKSATKPSRRVRGKGKAAKEQIGAIEQSAKDSSACDDGATLAVTGSSSSGTLVQERPDTNAAAGTAVPVLADAKCNRCEPAPIGAASTETPSGDTASPPGPVALAGQDGTASASAVDPAYLLAPADPATDEGASGDARSHAPPAFLSDDDDDALLRAAEALAWREPPTVSETLAALLDFGKVYAIVRKVERPVLRWHGGKWKLAPWIISHFPPHKVYIEPFGGAGSVLLQKPPALTEVWNDLEGEVVNLFSVLRNNAADLARLIYLTPFSRQEYHSLYEMVDDPIERARRFVARSFMGQSSKGALRKSGFDSRISSDGKPGRLPSLRAMPDEFYSIAERFRNVVIEDRPADEIFDQYDGEGVLFYVDPPYLSDRANHYTFEMDEAGHVALLTKLQALTGMVVLSGYASELYDTTLAPWRRIEIEAFADGMRPRTEVVWFNPACGAALDAEAPRLFDLASLDAANTPPSDLAEIEA